MTRLCLTLAEPSLSSLTRKLGLYNGRIPYIEVRLDHLEEPAIPTLPAEPLSQFIATCRPEREGGMYPEEEGSRLHLLGRAAGSGFHWVDLEHDVREAPSLPATTRVIRSYHDFRGFPDDLTSLFDRVRRAGGDVTKLAVSVSRTAQLVDLLRWMERLAEGPPSVIIGMGELGQASRLLGGFLGNSWTYVAEDGGIPAAPGQPTLGQCIDRYRLQEWESRPALYGVLGNPIAHSLSPALHNRLFEHYGLDKLYLPFLLDDLGAWMGYLQDSTLNFQGFSVTLPFKAEAAKLIRIKDSPVDSINTLLRDNSGWRGLNTDYEGFIRPLLDTTELSNKTVLVLGHGGVARTVVRALQDHGAAVIVAGRDYERVERFAREHGCKGVRLSDVPDRADVCVNTTPVGQHPDTGASLLEDHPLNFEVLYDLVYHPQRTRLLERAEERGARTISGMEMFLGQAALQFKSWTNIDPDRSLLRRLIEELLDS